MRVRKNAIDYELHLHFTPKLFHTLICCAGIRSLIFGEGTENQTRDLLYDRQALTLQSYIPSPRSLILERNYDISIISLCSKVSNWLMLPKPEI